MLLLNVAFACSTLAPVTAHLSATASVEAQSENVYQTVADKAAPAIVSVKYVMSYQTDSGEQSQENEVDGVIIDPSGIVLVSSTSMFGPEGMDMQIRPREIKILVGDDTAGLDAEVVVRDRERDLAWLRVTTESDEPRHLSAIAFAEGSKAELGDQIYQVWKLDKFFDRAPYVSEARVASVVSKPRNLVIASGEVSMGLPVFDAQGRVLGFCVLQLPTDEEMAAMSGSNMYSRMVFTRTILPAEQVAQATKQALASIEEDE